MAHNQILLVFLFFFRFRFCQNLNSASGAQRMTCLVSSMEAQYSRFMVCHVMSKSRDVSLFHTSETMAHFPHANESCKRKVKANAIGRLTVLCGKCCVPGAETSTVHQCVLLKGKREQVGGGGGVPFHESFGIKGVLSKFMSL